MKNKGKLSERSDAQRDAVERIGAERPSDANLKGLEGEEAGYHSHPEL